MGSLWHLRWCYCCWPASRDSPAELFLAAVPALFLMNLCSFLKWPWRPQKCCGNGDSGLCSGVVRLTQESISSTARSAVAVPPMLDRNELHSIQERYSLSSISWNMQSILVMMYYILFVCSGVRIRIRMQLSNLSAVIASQPMLAQCWPKANYVKAV